MTSSDYLRGKQYWNQRMLEIEPAQRKEHPYKENEKWHRIRNSLLKWVDDFDLNRGRVIEIGSGTGLLQDSVDNYVGIDYATNASRFMHKPFLVASAESLPFSDNSFDGAYSVWVLEHVNHPELMLSEIRRVLKPNGKLFLSAAYGIGDWVSQGIHIRPFGDLSIKGKFTKLSLPLRNLVFFRAVGLLPKRIALLVKYSLGKSQIPFGYKRIEPNYVEYLDNDSDACISIDSLSVAVYFLSRGDKFLSRRNIFTSLTLRAEPQLFIIKKLE